ncbi:hypothetical protein ACFQU2_05300 [Siccirubricoccus deserti]
MLRQHSPSPAAAKAQRLRATMEEVVTAAPNRPVAAQRAMSEKAVVHAGGVAATLPSLSQRSAPRA